MKKIFLLFLGLSFSINLAAQSHHAGTLSFQLGYDVGVHQTDYTSKYNGTLLSQDKDNAATTAVMFGAQYNLIEFLSLGLNFGAGSYIEDRDKIENNGNTFRVLSLDLRIYPINNEKFNWFLSPRLGVSNLKINRKVGPPILLISQESKYNSPHFGIYTGFNWYFLSFIGINAQLGYTNHNFLMKEYNINGVSQNLNNFENRLKVSGVQLQLGLSVKIN